jgi:hypothetical protein
MLEINVKLLEDEVHTVLYATSQQISHFLPSREEYMHIFYY